MEELAKEAARVALEVQRDLEEWLNDSNLSNESNVSNETRMQALSRIEDRLGDVHRHTSILVERVPEDLGQILTELKHCILTRLQGMVPVSRSRESDVAHQSNDSNASHLSATRMVQALTPQERRVFDLCLQSGLLTYREIASHLDISPGAAKNLVNKVFQSPDKRPLFSKLYKHRTVKVGVHPDLKRTTMETKKQHKGKRELVKALKPI
jgi:DNA-binding CsgD family transcriptional regulator